MIIVIGRQIPPPPGSGCYRIGGGIRQFAFFSLFFGSFLFPCFPLAADDDDVGGVKQLPNSAVNLHTYIRINENACARASEHAPAPEDAEALAGGKEWNGGIGLGEQEQNPLPQNDVSRMVW